MIVYLDLFSGIGGFALGLQQAGVKVKHHYFSEIDPHAIANYKYHFNESEYVGDIKFICGARLSHRPNLITFGFPCQDLSIAGQGKGFDGTRSVLFFEALRLIQETRPENFIFENVDGLLFHNGGKTFETVLRSIADLGIYDCEWQLLNTSWVLPQNRERIYFVGHLRGASKPEVFPFTKANRGFTQGKSITPVVRTITAGGKSGGHHSGMTLVSNLQGKDISNTLRSGGFSSHTDKHNFDTVKINYTQYDVSGKGHKSEQDIVYDTNGLMGCLGSHRLESKCNIEVRAVLTPDRAEKRQNGRRFKEDGEPAFTVNCQDLHGVSITQNDEVTYRRLTEVECERLQGFPDNWTKYGLYLPIAVEKLLKKQYKSATPQERNDALVHLINTHQLEKRVIVKTNRYKMIGNAVTTFVVQMVVERISYLFGAKPPGTSTHESIKQTPWFLNLKLD